MPEAKSRLVVQSVGDVTAVYFADSRILDETSIKAVSEELIKLADSSFKLKLMIDFTNVEYLSSAVLGKLVAIHKKVMEGKGTMKMCGIRPAILQVFKITKLDKLFDIHADQTAALNSFKAKGNV